MKRKLAIFLLIIWTQPLIIKYSSKPWRALSRLCHGRFLVKLWIWSPEQLWKDMHIKFGTAKLWRNGKVKSSSNRSDAIQTGLDTILFHFLNCRVTYRYHLFWNPQNIWKHFDSNVACGATPSVEFKKMLLWHIDQGPTYAKIFVLPEKLRSFELIH